MPLRKQKGNMYPWVTHTHSHLRGECPHKCNYCYLNNPRFGRHINHTGKIRLAEEEFDVDYGTGRTIFIENCNDLFAEEVQDGLIVEVLQHCQMYPDNIYVFQTKNPRKYRRQCFKAYWPPKKMFGVTIETNRDINKNVPSPKDRMEWFSFMDETETTFVTIEPVLNFDLNIMIDWIHKLNPNFVNIGADSKGHNLEEPDANKLRRLIIGLKSFGITVIEKDNLKRLMKQEIKDG